MIFLSDKANRFIKRLISKGWDIERIAVFIAAEVFREVESFKSTPAQSGESEGEG